MSKDRITKQDTTVSTIYGAGRPKGGYELDGVKYDSVTTVAGRFGEKGGLMQWAFKQGKKGLPHLYAEKDALSIGSLAHDMAAAFLHGKKRFIAPKGTSAEVKTKAKMAFVAWKEEWEINEYEVLSVEVPIISKSLKLAGTPDAIVRDKRGRVGVVDYKTGKGIYEDHLLQAAAYRKLIETEMPRNVQFAQVLRCHKESGQVMTARWTADFLDEAWELFDLYRQAFPMSKSLKARM